jgi:hypothetical protein
MAVPNSALEGAAAGDLWLPILCLWHDIRMRIGTWNMEGRGGPGQTAFLLEQKCDVLLLTEVKEGWLLPGYNLTPGEADMAPSKRWAAVASKESLVPCQPPHPASAAAVVGGTTYVSSILPWAGSGGNDPWQGEDHPARVASTLQALAPFLREQADLVWGGDWNHSLAGPERAGSDVGRADLLSLVEELGLDVPTADLPHRRAGLLSIDHVALRRGSEEARRVVAYWDGERLSDHDFYVVVAEDSPR